MMSPPERFSGNITKIQRENQYIQAKMGRIMTLLKTNEATRKSENGLEKQPSRI